MRHDPEIGAEVGADRVATTDPLAELLGDQEHRLLWTRRKVAPLVLEAARLAYNRFGIPSATGKEADAGEAPGALLGKVSSRSQRILRDAIAYDQGTRLSMYWGPIERKHDAIFLLSELATATANRQPHS
jgi:hypothetical protein